MQVHTAGMLGSLNGDKLTDFLIFVLRTVCHNAVQGLVTESDVPEYFRAACRLPGPPENQLVSHAIFFPCLV